MIIQKIHYRIFEDRLIEYMGYFDVLYNYTLDFPGVISHDLFKSLDSNNEFILITHFKSNGDASAWFESSVRADYLRQAENCFQELIEFNKYDVLSIDRCS